MSKKERKSHGLLMGLVVGGAIGSVASIVLNSKKGKKARRHVGGELGKAGQSLLEKMKKNTEGRE